MVWEIKSLRQKKFKFIPETFIGFRRIYGMVHLIFRDSIDLGILVCTYLQPVRFNSQSDQSHSLFRTTFSNNIFFKWCATCEQSFEPVFCLWDRELKVFLALPSGLLCQPNYVFDIYVIFRMSESVGLDIFFNISAPKTQNRFVGFFQENIIFTVTKLVS